MNKVCFNLTAVLQAGQLRTFELVHSSLKIQKRETDGAIRLQLAVKQALIV